MNVLKCPDCGNETKVGVDNIKALSCNCGGIKKLIKAQKVPVANEGLARLAPTNKQLDLACLSKHHGYGLMDEDEKALLQWQAKEWLVAWRKAYGTYGE